MTKNIIITILTLLLLITGSISVIAANNVSYRSSFWVNQQTNKVDINTYNYENMTCVIVVAHTNAPKSVSSSLSSPDFKEGYGSNPAVSCIKNN